MYSNVKIVLNYHFYLRNSIIMLIFAPKFKINNNLIHF